MNTKIVWRRLLLALLLMSCWMIMPVTAALWFHETVDNTGFSLIGGESIKVYSGDLCGLSYIKIKDDDLKYAFQFPNHTWAVGTICNGNGLDRLRVAALDYDPETNRERISYSRGEFYTLYYAWWHPDTGWTHEVVDPSSYSGSKSLVSFAEDRSAIAYTDTTLGSLNYAEEDSNGEWQYYPIDVAGGVEGDVSMAFKSGGRPCIAYYNYNLGDLQYMWWDPEGWHKTTIDSEGDSGGSLSLAVGSDDKVHISYSAKNGVFYQLKYAYQYDGQHWITQLVDDGDDGNQVGFCNAIALNANNQPRIAYYDYSNDRLKFAYHGNDGVWHNSTLLEINAGRYGNSMTIDSYGHEHIATSSMETLEHVWRVRFTPNKAVFRPSATTNWIIDKARDGSINQRDHYGTGTDIPLAGQFSPDEVPDRAVFRAGKWIIDNSMDGSVNTQNNFGMTGDIPVVGSIRTIQSHDRAVFRNGQWIIDWGMNGGIDRRDNFGQTGDIPLVGDFNNDNVPDRAVFRGSASNNWIFDYSFDGTVDARNHYGSPGDKPLVGDLNDDGICDRVVFRSGVWIIDYDMDGSVDSRQTYGMIGDIPLFWPQMVG